MVNLSTVYFESIILLLALVFGTFIFLKESHFWDKSKRDTVKMVIGVLFAGITVYLSLIHVPACFDPKISVFEGTFTESGDKYRHELLLMKYSFTDEENNRRGFTLDIITKRKILNGDFEKGKKYRVYYEERTDIIVMVEY